MPCLVSSISLSRSACAVFTVLLFHFMIVTRYSLSFLLLSFLLLLASWRIIWIFLTQLLSPPPAPSSLLPPLWSGLCRRELHAQEFIAFAFGFDFHFQLAKPHRHSALTANCDADSDCNCDVGSCCCCCQSRRRGCGYGGIRLNFIWRQQRRGLRRRSASSNMLSRSAIYRSGGAGRQAVVRVAWRLSSYQTNPVEQIKCLHLQALQTVTKFRHLSLALYGRNSLSLSFSLSYANCHLA